MRILVKFPRFINGKLYSVGQHSLPDGLADHWFVRGLAKDGDIKFLEEPKTEKAISEKPEEEASLPQKKRKG
jgi:hypothetical protein